MVRKGWLVAAMLFLLTACAPTTVQPVVSGFRCRAEIVYGESEFVGTLDRTEEQAATLSLFEPEGMNGVSMRWERGGHITVGYGGMSMSMSEEELPVGAVIGVLCDTLDACVEGTVQERVVEGVCDCGQYTLTLEEQSGLPQHLSVPSIALEVEFSAWELPQT